jgi:hypothetical protein
MLSTERGRITTFDLSHLYILNLQVVVCYCFETIVLTSCFIKTNLFLQRMCSLLF